MKMFISFLIVFGFTTVLASGAPVTTENSCNYNTRITKGTGTAINPKLNDIQENGSTYEDFVRTFMTPIWTSALSIPFILNTAIDGGVEGASDGLNKGDLANLLLYAVGGFAESGTPAYQEAATRAVYSGLKGCGPGGDKMTCDALENARKDALEKLDAQTECCTDIEQKKFWVNNCINRARNLVYGVAEYATTPFEVAVPAAAKGLITGGVCESVKCGTNGLNKGAVLGSQKILNRALL